MLKNLRNCRGVAAVEFALLAPFLFVLLFLIVEGSFIYFNQQVIANASREGARAGILAVTPKLTAEQIRQIAKDYCKDRLVPPTIPDVDVGGAGGPSLTPLWVRVRYPYRSFVLFAFINTARQWTFGAETVMRHE